MYSSYITCQCCSPDVRDVLTGTRAARTRKTIIYLYFPYIHLCGSLGASIDCCVIIMLLRTVGAKWTVMGLGLVDAEAQYPPRPRVHHPRRSARIPFRSVRTQHELLLPRHLLPQEGAQQHTQRPA